MLGPVSKNESPYKKTIKELARIAQYQPIASIPQPSQGFNYTLVRNRYSDYYQTPKVMKKSKNNAEDKLSTILETHGRSPLFPKIAKNKQNTSEQSRIESSKKKVKRLRSFFKKQNDTTVASRQRSLTIDTRLETDQDRKMQNQSQLKEIKKYDKPFSLGSRTAQRQQLHSNSSQLSLLISRRKNNQSQIESQVHQTHEPTVYQPSAPGIFLEEEDEDSDDSGQFEKDAVPGPGSYNFSYSDFDKTKNTRSTNVSFLSNKTRFRYQEKQEEKPKVVNPIKEEKEEKRQKRLRENRPKKVEVPFGLRSPRIFECDQKKQKAPGPQYYYPRQGMQESLIRSIQHHFKGKFGSHSPRFKYQNPQNPHLAPGCYQPPQFQDTLQQNQNFYFKSNKPRF